MNQVSKSSSLFLDCHMTVPELHTIATGQAAVYSARCPGKTPPNEDAAGLIPFDDQSGVLVVADGLGGAVAGDRGATLAIECVTASIVEGLADGLMLRTAILNGFEAANNAVLALGIGAATTLAIVEIQGNTARPYHVGDSMILVTGGRGKIKLQTTSHSPVGFAIEAGLLDEQDAMHHEDRHLVSNVIGSAEMKIEIGSSIKLAPRDTILVASDGVSDNLHVAETVECIRKRSLTHAANRLAAHARSRMKGNEQTQPSKPDDLTFILFRLMAAHFARRRH